MLKELISKNPDPVGALQAKLDAAMADRENARAAYLTAALADEEDATAATGKAKADASAALRAADQRVADLRAAMKAAQDRTAADASKAEKAEHARRMAAARKHAAARVAHARKLDKLRLEIVAEYVAMARETMALAKVFPGRVEPEGAVTNQHSLESKFRSLLLRDGKGEAFRWAASYRPWRPDDVETMADILEAGNEYLFRG